MEVAGFGMTEEMRMVVKDALGGRSDPQARMERLQSKSYSRNTIDWHTIQSHSCKQSRRMNL